MNVLSGKQEPVFDLIRSMSKAEKRNFKLYATRLSGNQEAKFISLFDCMDMLEEYDETKTVDNTVEIALSVQGKARDAVEIPVDADEDTAFAAAMKREKFASLIEGKQIVKKIYVKNKILNVIVK